MGAIVTAAPTPSIPRWLDNEKYGQAFIMSVEKGKSPVYNGFLEMSWDFDYDCYRYAWAQYSDDSWGEESSCNGRYIAYDSTTDQCTNP